MYCKIIYSIAAPQQSVSGQQQIGKLNEGQVRSLTYSLPPGGLTLELNASSGEVNVYVSYSIHNPTYFTADVITGGSGYFTRYVPPRDSPVEDSEYVFVSLIAKKNNTKYSLDVTTGNVLITRLSKFNCGSDITLILHVVREKLITPHFVI